METGYPEAVATLSEVVVQLAVRGNVCREAEAVDFGRVVAFRGDLNAAEGDDVRGAAVDFDRMAPASRSTTSNGKLRCSARRDLTRRSTWDCHCSRTTKERERQRRERADEAVKKDRQCRLSFVT